MSYTVVWVPATEQELAELWMKAERRRRVTEAAREIDSRFRTAAADEGESVLSPFELEFSVV